MIKLKPAFKYFVYGLRVAFVDPVFWTVSLSFSVVGWYVVVWAVNYRLLKLLPLLSGFGKKAFFILRIWPIYRLSFFGISQIAIIVSLLLYGLISGLVYCHIKRRNYLFGHTAGAGILGLSISAVSAGCALCGFSLLIPLLGQGVAVLLVGALPWQGSELYLLSVSILLFTFIVSSYELGKPAKCKIN